MRRLGFNRGIQTRAISSVYGKIEQLLLAYPSGLANANHENVAERYGEIFRAFNDRVTFVVMGHFGEASDLAEKAKQAFETALLENSIDPAHHLVFCHTPFAGSLCKQTHDLHSEFAQDPFLVMQSNYGHTVLLEPMVQTNPENVNVAEQLAVKAGYLIQPSLLQFEGGNFLVGDDYALIGKNVLQANLPFASKMDSDPQRWLETYLKQTLSLRYIIWVGTDEMLDLGAFHSTGPQKMQPFFHVDLFTTLLGKTKSGKECILLAKIDLDAVGHATVEDKALLTKINLALDAIENALEKVGIDHPGPIFEVHRNEIGGQMLSGAEGSRFVPYPSNNAQVEVFEGIRRIYLPSFPKMKKLEDKFQEQLLRLGFTNPRMITNQFDNYAKNGGTLHCLSSVLLREE